MLVLEAILFRLWLAAPSLWVLNQYQHNSFGSSFFQFVVPRLVVKSAKIDKLVEMQIVDVESSESSMRPLGPLLCRLV